MTELNDVDHTHPETGESFGEMVAYRRGPAPVESSDGAEAEADTSAAVTADGGRVDENDTLADVSHEADVEVQSAYERDSK